MVLFICNSRPPFGKMHRPGAFITKNTVIINEVDIITLRNKNCTQLFVCLLAELHKNYWLEPQEKKSSDVYWSNLVPLNLESDLDHLFKFSVSSLS